MSGCRKIVTVMPEIELKQQEKREWAVLRSVTKFQRTLELVIAGGEKEEEEKVSIKPRSGPGKSQCRCGNGKSWKERGEWECPVCVWTGGLRAGL